MRTFVQYSHATEGPENWGDESSIKACKAGAALGLGTNGDKVPLYSKWGAIAEP